MPPPPLSRGKHASGGMRNNKKPLPSWHALAALLMPGTAATAHANARPAKLQRWDLRRSDRPCAWPCCKQEWGPKKWALEGVWINMAAGPGSGPPRRAAGLRLILKVNTQTVLLRILTSERAG